MDMVERVARALAANEGYDPDETWEEFDRNAAATDMMCGGIPDDQIFLKFVRWREYEVQALAAIRAMLEGQEPVAWRYDDDGEIWACAVKPEPIVWDGWTETPLYDLSALNEVVG